ncbi:hypothetical protein Tco_1161276, partial [Tanacetum coccineum]
MTSRCKIHPDDVALIPYTRVDDFIFEESFNVESPTRFHIERGRKRKKGSLKKFNSDEYLEFRLRVVEKEVRWKRRVVEEDVRWRRKVMEEEG